MTCFLPPKFRNFISRLRVDGVYKFTMHCFLQGTAQLNTSSLLTFCVVHPVTKSRYIVIKAWAPIEVAQLIFTNCSFMQSTVNRTPALLPSVHSPEDSGARSHGAWGRTEHTHTPQQGCTSLALTRCLTAFLFGRKLEGKYLQAFQQKRVAQRACCYEHRGEMFNFRYFDEWM